MSLESPEASPLKPAPLKPEPLKPEPLKLQPHFPFTAIAGQESFKLALILAAINPLIGGVLVSGPRGSAKSTLAKALVDILPRRQRQAAAPFVGLPLGASEDMLIGTLNLQKALKEQDVTFQPGLLAKAHGGVLYIDEVNLLPDNLVDQLLDVAASGINIIERDGISHQHPAAFILLGTMNPDEGELRPQLIDRFGLAVNLSGQYAIDERIEIVKRREAFDRDPRVFCEDYRQQQQHLAATIEAAQQRLLELTCPDHCRHLIAQRCSAAQVDGLRADIVWIQAALAHAAFVGNLEVTEDDVLAVAELVLEHRRQHNTDKSTDKSANNSPTTSNSPPPPPFTRPDDSTRRPSQGRTPGTEENAQENTQESPEGDWGAIPAEPEEPALEKMTPLAWPSTEMPRRENRRNRQPSPGLSADRQAQGSAQGLQRSSSLSAKVNWFRSLAANMGQWPLQTLRYHHQRQGRAVIHLVLLDTSGSTLAHQALAKAKGLLVQLAERAYLRREQLAILGFGNQSVKTLLGLRRSPKAIEKYLSSLQVGGGTPLPLALAAAETFQQQRLSKNPSVEFKHYIITDGRVSHLPLKSHLQGEITVVDIEQSPVKRGRAQQLATVFSAHYMAL